MGKRFQETHGLHMQSFPQKMSFSVFLALTDVLVVLNMRFPGLLLILMGDVEHIFCFKITP